MICMDTLFSDAFKHHQNKNIAAAEEGYLKVLTIEPAHPSALHLLGLIEYKKNNYEDAITLVKKSLELAPKDLQWMKNYGKILKDAGRIEESISIYEKARKQFEQKKNNIGLEGNIDFDWEPPYPITKTYIKSAVIENISLDDLKVVELADVSGETFIYPKRIRDCVSYKYLSGDPKPLEEYNKYLQWNKNFNCHYLDDRGLDELTQSVKKNGYPFQNKYMCIYNNENIIRDGRNRSAVLRYLWGNRIVPIVRFTVNGTLQSWIPKEGEKIVLYKG